MTSAEPSDPAYRLSAGRSIGLGLVVLLHAALIYAEATAPAHRTVKVAPVLVEARIVAAMPPPTTVTAPPMVAPPPPAQTPPPKAAAPPRPPVPHHAATKLEPQPPPSPAPIATVAPPAPPPPVQAMPRLDLAHSREPEYPLQSRQLGEQGSVLLQVLVDIDGRVREVKLAQSSGYDRLDQAALREIKSAYRFLPGTVDGTPQPMWYTIKYNWKLR